MSAATSKKRSSKGKRKAAEPEVLDTVPQRFGLNNVDWQQRIDWNDLRLKRVNRAHEFLAKHGLGAAIVYNHDRKRYLSAVWNHPYAKQIPDSFVLLIRDAGFPYVHVAPIDVGRVIEDCPWLTDRLLDDTDLLQPHITRFHTPETAKREFATCATQVKRLLKKHGVADLPIAIDYTAPSMVQAFEAKGMTVVDGSYWIDDCGMVKFDDEIVCMKTAAAINEAGYGAVIRDVRVGMKEYEVQGIMAKGIYDAGGEYIEGWVVNAGDRGNPRSFNWADRPLRPREFMSLEACHVNWCGYKVCYDRTFIIGAKPSELQHEVYQTVVEMHDKFRELLKPGVSTHELAEKRPKPGENMRTPEQIRKWRATWSNHFGGMGIAWNSAPYFFSVDDPEFVLERNMILAYHGMMWADGEDGGGVAIENTYRITDNGAECMTKWPYEDAMILGL
ncbi:MAG: M24 family metallopeptidase [Rhodospirillales bacterium]|jgi:Xaa-Pro aminopeptidase|nr:hypothetical protein [Rhodospirillaceae bacterium]MDP6429955.1 M24 family metallopeptidase [Rhodospirillales bacterium]MDP6646762.1 M24 family metallopeptidase [Rhodospirillales bacterium]